jgi:hypothetical protein
MGKNTFKTKKKRKKSSLWKTNKKRVFVHYSRVFIIYGIKIGYLLFSNAIYGILRFFSVLIFFNWFRNLVYDWIA